MSRLLSQDEVHSVPGTSVSARGEKLCSFFCVCIRHVKAFPTFASSMPLLPAEMRFSSMVDGVTHFRHS